MINPGLTMDGAGPIKGRKKRVTVSKEDARKRIRNNFIQQLK